MIQAIGGALGTTASIGHEVLFTGVDFLQFPPVPGLDLPGKILLNIWDAVEKVSVSVMLVPIRGATVTDNRSLDESSSVSAPDRTLREHPYYSSRRDRKRRLHRN